MNVTAHFHGLISDWIGAQTVKFDLSSGAKLADLMTEIERRFKDNMPDKLWEQKANGLKDIALALGAEGIPMTPENPLKDGEEIKFFLMVSGG